MKIIQNSIYEIWCQLTDRLLRMKGKPEKEFKTEGKLAWEIIMRCADPDGLSAGACAAFWAAWGNCNVTYSDIAKLLDENQKNKWRKKKNKPVSLNNVKSLLSDAREQIQKGIDTELLKIQFSYER